MTDVEKCKVEQWAAKKGYLLEKWVKKRGLILDIGGEEQRMTVYELFLHDMEKKMNDDQPQKEITTKSTSSPKSPRDGRDILAPTSSPQEHGGYYPGA